MRGTLAAIDLEERIITITNEGEVISLYVLEGERRVETGELVTAVNEEEKPVYMRMGTRYTDTGKPILKI